LTGQTHVLIGVASTIFLIHLTGEIPSRLEFGLVILGAVLPDIDGHGMVCRLFFGLNTVSAIIKQIFGHRGFFHWLFLPFFIMAGAYFAGAGWFWLGFGYLTHLLADSLTPSGIPAHPISRRMSANLIKTGSVSEWVLFAVLLVGVVRSGFPLLPPDLQQLLLKTVASIDS
jgi:inner membrane protein